MVHIIKQDTANNTSLWIQFATCHLEQIVAHQENQDHYFYIPFKFIKWLNEYFERFIGPYLQQLC